MELVGIIKNGKVELPASVHLPDGAEVRVIIQTEAPAEAKPFEDEPISEASVIADVAWATGRRFDS